MAMVVSWTHLHDLMATRGQLAIVAILGPLAIDGMAIMATGLILSTRVAMATDGHVAIEADTDRARLDRVLDMATAKLATDGHLATPDMATDGQILATWPDPDMTTFPANPADQGVDILATRPDG